jgi:cleavage and polyadenylation specificity factor subunit 2
VNLLGINNYQDAEHYPQSLQNVWRLLPLERSASRTSSGTRLIKWSDHSLVCSAVAALLRPFCLTSSSMFTFTPLLGGRANSSATQSIIELDGGVKILIDVGWDERFDVSQLYNLERLSNRIIAFYTLLTISRHLSTLSFVLLTHATTSHLGAFAHLSKNYPLFSQIPVYATTPVISLGRTLLQDLYSSTPLAATFLPSAGSASKASLSSLSKDARSTILMQAPTAEEITRYFQRITPLKYSQPHQPSASDFSPPLEGLVLTAYNAGHTLGGTIWHIQHGMESVIYAVDWNQARENVMGGAAWFGGFGGSEVIEPLRKPSALVCSSKNGDRPSLLGGKKKRDQLLLDNIRSSLSKGGNVLIPSDSSARVLELAYVLEKAWQEAANDHAFKNARVYMSSRSAVATMKHAQSLLEWMDESIVREFEGEDESVAKTHKRGGSKETNGVSAKPSKPFELQHVKLIERPKQLERALRKDGPKVILASDLSFSWGLSKLALCNIAQKSENLVVFTEKVHLGSESEDLTVAQTLWQILEKKEDGVALEKSSDGGQLDQIHGGGKPLDVLDVQKMPLDADEQQIYQQYMATQRQLQSSLISGTETGKDENENIADDSSNSSSEDSDDEHQGRALNVSAALGHAGRAKRDLSDQDLGVSILLRKKGVYDFDVRSFKRGRNAVFPYIHHRKRGDEFGEYIKPEEYLRAEEKEDADSRGTAQADHKLGQKRKWHDLGGEKNDVGNNKRRRGRKGVRSTEKISGTIVNSEVDDTNVSDDSDADSEPEIIEGPVKAVFHTHSTTLNARLAFVDFAGLHDQRSLQNLIPKINPRKLILIGGSEKETQALAFDCKTLLAAKEGEMGGEPKANVFTPSVGQVIDASVDTNAWIVKLGSDLVKRLQWQNVHNMGVVTLTGELKGGQPSNGPLGEEENTRKKQKLIKSDPEEKPPRQEAPNDVSPILDLVRANMAAATRSVAQSLHVGDIRLADLRRLMGSVGYTAEFRGEGTLLIDGNIAVRKLGTGKIVVEGSPVSATSMSAGRSANTFYDVRRTIYDGLAVIAGG